MDDVTFAARRASEGTQRPEAPDLETRFKALVQSPLRAGILRFLTARPGEAFDSDTIMQAFGRMRLDVDNCVNELVDFGVVKKVAGRSADLRRDHARATNRSPSCSRSSSRAAPTSASKSRRHRCSASAK